MILYVPKVIEDARLWQASEAPQHNKGCYGGGTSVANAHAASKAKGIEHLSMLQTDRSVLA